jgi:act minimal PKS chain-length factor (CLF/KS beta)
MSGVVVTGIGIVAPNGLGLADYWSATLRGRSGLGPLSRFDASGYPARLAGEVPGFVPADHVPSRLLPQTDHMTRLALTAADWALADAGADLAALPEFGAGVITAASSGGFEFGQRELAKLWTKGSAHVSVYQSFAWFYAVNTGQISIRNAARGPAGVLVNGQAGGLDAIAHARREVRRGTGLMITGGVDGALCPWGWAAQLSSGELSTRDDPGRAYLPFDADANGFVPGEGGAILVLQDARQATGQVYGEIAGHASTFDPHPASGREPGLRRAIELALSDAGLSAEDIDVVFADAYGLPAQDLAEAQAITAVFGQVPVTAPKTMTGRLYSGGAPLDLATALLSIRDGVIPPTTGVTNHYDIDLVTTPRPCTLRAALVLARGHGGFNSAMVVRGPDRKGTP